MDGYCAYVWLNLRTSTSNSTNLHDTVATDMAYYLNIFFATLSKNLLFLQMIVEVV